MRIDPEFGRASFAAFHRAGPIECKGMSGLRPRPRQPALQLLTQVMKLAGPQAELLCHAERPWASATFSGTRHTIMLAFEGESGMEAGDLYCERLPEHEFAISHQLVADAAVLEVTTDMLSTPRLVVEAQFLLLEDS